MPAELVTPQTTPLTRSPQAVSSLSIVLPCFNEAGNVDEAITAALEAGARCATDLEVIVVDDGSKDDTATIAAARVETDERVRLVQHTYNRGYGDAVRSGIAAAGKDWILLTDGDLQFDLRELEGFLPRAPHADVIVGWRVLRQDPLHRRINAAAWNWLVRHLFKLPVRDVDCAFKLIRRGVAQACPLRASGAVISTELLAGCIAQGARIEQIGVRHLPRVAGTPTGARPRVVLRALREVVALRLR